MGAYSIQAAKRTYQQALDAGLPASVKVGLIPMIGECLCWRARAQGAGGGGSATLHMLCCSPKGVGCWSS